MVAERLQKALARAGVASRRAAEQLIREGRVAVNGQVVRELGTRVDPARDRVTVDGQPLAPPAARHYVLLNKPRGYVSTARDEWGRPTVLDLVPREGRLYPVGRLDADSEGLLLLTDDGDFALRLTHPRYKVPKEYHVLVPAPVPAEALVRLRAGVELAEGRTAPAEVAVLRHEPPGTWLRVVLRQGWKRQVRRMLAAVGLPVARLVRVRVGGLTLGDLPPGAWRALSPAEARRALGSEEHAPRDHRHRRARGGR